jgi:uncharacterized protein YfaS (alpha-2-macroglobulin family)
MQRRFASALLLLGWMLVLPFLERVRSMEEETIEQRRTKAQQLRRDGNFQEAWNIFRQLATTPQEDGKLAGGDLQAAYECLPNIGQWQELDRLLQGAVGANPEQWRVLVHAANLLLSSPHYGMISEEKFQRAPQDNTGTWVETTELDRRQALRWMVQAIPLLDRENDRAEAARSYLHLATALWQSRDGRQAWRLLEKTNLEAPVDYLDRDRQDQYVSRYASVDDRGHAIFHALPASWESAGNDGERIRWALQEAIELDKEVGWEAMVRWAAFLNGQMGVDTLSDYTAWFARPTNSSDPKELSEGILSVHTLNDDETIARLSSGIQRFAWPQEHNPIAIYQQIAKEGSQPHAESALYALANIYLNRRQHSKAAAIWKESIERFGPGPDRWKELQLDQIIGPQGRFETAPTQLAGEKTSLDLVFRNATKVSFEARSVDLEAIVAETKKFYREATHGNPSQFGGVPNQGPPDFQGLQQLFPGEQIDRFVRGEPVRWDTDLKPLENHWDQREELETPLTKAGLYVVTAQLDGGKRTLRTLLWIQDMAIVRKTLENQFLYYVADAATGKPLEGVQLELLGIQYRPVEAKRGERIFDVILEAGKTNREGTYLLDPSRPKPPVNQWMVIARGPEGRFATLGLEGLWNRGIDYQNWTAIKAFGVSDRPMYRPGDTISARLWLGIATYDPAGETSLLAGTQVTVRLIDGQGNRVWEQVATTDRWGGVDAKVTLGRNAGLGAYQFQIERSPNEFLECNLRLRVEEYRKPEFEVTITAPQEPVALGETIRAKVKATYYYGGPVADAKAVLRVHRSAMVESFFPMHPFDWCYGPGAWWLPYDAPWYPGWDRWRGCLSPYPWWIPRQQFEPEELVIDREVTLDASGEAILEIDTATAKQMLATHDHRYRITAEVTDASRRTIDASGQVIAARRPFRIYTWLDRGHYRVGDPIVAHFQARTSDGSPVQGEGTVELLRVTYGADRKPSEKLVQSWPVKTDEQGKVEQKLEAEAGGQYRIRLVLKSNKGQEEEGASLLTIRGPGDRADDFRFEGLQLIPDKTHYQPGETMRLQINSDRSDARVALFVRAGNGASPKPQWVDLKEKTAVVEVKIEPGDQPNFFVDAFTVHDGQVLEVTREILVPPEQRMLDLQVKLDRVEYLPGGEAVAELQLLDAKGQPVEGNTVIAVYDRSLEAIAGDVLPGDIREYFWKWRRNHWSDRADNLAWQTWPIPIGPVQWTPLGIFGWQIDEQAASSGAPMLGGMVPRRTSMMRGINGRGGMAGRMGGFGGGGAMVADAMMAAPAAPMAGAMGKMAEASGAMADGSAPAPGQETPAVAVRKDFADSALWIAAVPFDARGKGTIRFKMPENLTSWKLKTWAVGPRLAVGSAQTQAVTRKPLLVRLQAPRFLVERDRVAIAAIVQNDLSKDQEVEVRLEIDGQTQLDLAEGETAVRKVKVAAGGQERIDFLCRAVAEGTPKVRVFATAADGQDATELSLPVLVRGFLLTDSFAGTLRGQQREGKANLVVPEKRRSDQSRLVVRVSPSLAAAMVDALPYLADYPYGCTEQTLNRFLPTVITRKTLQQMQVDLASLAKERANLNAQEIGNAADRAKQWKRWPREAVYDEAMVDDMLKTGLRRLADMQNSDGGWGWFSGVGEQSYPHTTAVVVRGLLAARDADVPVVPDLVDRGVAWLAQYQSKEKNRLLGLDLPEEKRKEAIKLRTPDNLDALICHVLAEAGQIDQQMVEVLYDRRQSLNVYGKALLAMVTHRAGNQEQTAMLRRNIEQLLVQDEENETAFLRDGSPYWYWYGSSIEAAATYLKLLTRIDPKGPTAPRLVKYLLNQRKADSYWSSTRDTALVVEAFADYLEATGETAASSQVEVLLGGKRLGSLAFTPKTLWTAPNTIEIEGDAIPGGNQQLTLVRTGEGPIYWNAYATYFTQEDQMPEAGLELKIRRNYYLLKPKAKDLTLANEKGGLEEAQQLGWERIDLEQARQLPSGSQVEVELIVESKNDYEYLMIEDRKPASLEPIDLQSGYVQTDGLFAYRELRDQQVVFFLRTIDRGVHSLRYRVRAEAPGEFTSLPARVSAMYAPELIGSSANRQIEVVDVP